MPKPTLAEQIAAVALLRTWVSNGQPGDELVVEAFNTLDDADLFADLDQERDAAEATREDRT